MREELIHHIFREGGKGSAEGLDISDVVADPSSTELQQGDVLGVGHDEDKDKKDVLQKR